MKPWRRRAAWVVAAVLCWVALLSGCARRPALQPEPRVVVGAPWPGQDGVWFYPREDYALNETGLAETYPDKARAGTRTADGEVYDPTALSVAHQTLQLPAIATLTDLDTGRSVNVRVNDRGPTDPARIVLMSPRVATLLGVPKGGVARVRLRVLESESRAAVDALGGGPSRLIIASAPVGTVTATALPPPPGARGDAPGPSGAVPSAAVAPSAATAPPLRLPENVIAGPPSAAPLMIDLGRFSVPAYAERQAARSNEPGARVRAMRDGRRLVYDVVAGPYGDVAEADAALRRMVRNGVLDARIVVDEETAR
jgi:rare lipoprotein A